MAVFRPYKAAVPQVPDTLDKILLMYRRTPRQWLEDILRHNQ